MAGLSLTCASAPSESFLMGRAPSGRRRCYPASRKAAFLDRFYLPVTSLTFRNTWKQAVWLALMTSKFSTKFRNHEDTVSLQADLDSLSAWSKIWHLKLNPAKCKTISFTLRKTPIRCAYTLDEHRLDRCEQIRDLGVILDSKLTFADHVHSTVSKANRMLRLLMRSVQTSPCSRRLHFDHRAILSAYNAHVRSVLEYASVMWSVAAVSHLKRLERLQHRFLMWLGCKSMHRCPSMDYDSLLKHFKCLSIKARFTQADVVFMQSVFRGRLDCGKLVSMFSLSAPIRRTRHTRFVPCARRKDKLCAQWLFVATAGDL